ncbi:MAG TPA: DUF438 domain-containing protein [bacterium]|jgi:hypothetical protein
MSELIDNSKKRKDLLKHMILELHKGAAPEVVKSQLVRLMGQIPYGDVVQVEQELISEGLPQEEVLRMCDVHSAALKGQIDLSGVKAAPPGHPVDTFTQENNALEELIGDAEEVFGEIEAATEAASIAEPFERLHELFGKLWEVDKHYRRKENLLFPYMEKQGITGPPTVMWGKDDQVRSLIKGTFEVFKLSDVVDADQARALVQLSFRPALEAVSNMIVKESQILLPMCMDLLSDTEWYEIAEQSPEIGFCLYDPSVRWVPENLPATEGGDIPKGRIVLPTGSFDVAQLAALFNALPVDITFVDKDDTVRYFSLGKERIFQRDRAIIGRQVQFCHPPKSVHVVNQILDDFRAGRQDKAEFWIHMGPKFVHISYYAVRGEAGDYLGTVEVTMDLTRYRALEGERRLLNYETEEA